MTGNGWRRSIGGASAALAATALAAALAACGGSSATGATTASAPTATQAPATQAATQPPTHAATQPATHTTATSTSAKSRPGDVPPPTTPAGAKLSIGQTARVGYHPVDSTGSGKTSTLEVTVESFQKGSLSDFNGIQLDAAQKAAIPYYVRVHVINLGPAAVDVDGTAAAIEGVDSTGSNQSSVTFIGSFPRCPDAASTTPIPAGKGYNDCMTFLIPGGIRAISYNGTDAYIGSPVTWAP